jgi:uncharacterized protein YaiI (UPF0178 family)
VGPGEIATGAVIADAEVVQAAADEDAVVARDVEVTVAAAEGQAAVTAARDIRDRSSTHSQRVRDETRGLFCA